MPEPGIGRPDERVAAVQAAMPRDSGTGQITGSAPVGSASYMGGGSDLTDVITQLRTPTMRRLQGQYGATGGLEDILTKEQFFAQNQMTLTNPFGIQGLYTRVGKRPPSSIDYSGLMDEKTRRGLMDLAYDRYLNPFAKTNIFGDEVFGNPETGKVRSGLDSFGSPKETYLGDVVDVPVPKSKARGLAEMIPGGIGLLIKMLPAEKRKMIEARMLPDGIPTAAQGRAEYEASKPKGDFLENLRKMGRGE